MPGIFPDFAFLFGGRFLTYFQHAIYQRVSINKASLMQTSHEHGRRDFIAISH